VFVLRTSVLREGQCDDVSPGSNGIAIGGDRWSRRAYARRCNDLGGRSAKAPFANRSATLAAIKLAPGGDRKVRAETVMWKVGAAGVSLRPSIVVAISRTRAWRRRHSLDILKI